MLILVFQYQEVLFVYMYYIRTLYVNIYIETFSFGGLYGTRSNYGDVDVTGDGAMEFFTNRRKVTQKWTASYSTGPDTKKTKLSNSTSSNGVNVPVDKANFDGRM